MRHVSADLALWAGIALHPVVSVAQTDTDPAVSLAGAKWTVIAVGQADVPEGVDVTMEFAADGRIAGGSGCNRYFGGFSLTADGLTFDPNMAGTMMACDDAIMSLEVAFFDALFTVTGYDLGDDGDLVLLSGDLPVIHAVR